LGGKPRPPNLEKNFIPVGHISLNTKYEDPGEPNPGEGVYWIATFYISAALQGTGLGRAAMDAVESMATSEPLCAQALALSTSVDVDASDPRWAALGKMQSQVRNKMSCWG
jgi:GNAT superfamily N-acetyltransferase